MIIPNAKIEKAASNDNDRPKINVVRLDVESKTLMAADGYVMACIPVETHDGDESCQMTPATFKAARKSGNRVAYTTVSKTDIPGLGTFYNGELSYPKGITKLIDHAEKAISEGEHIFTLDINKLLQVAESLDSHYLKFYRTENEELINGSEAYAVQPTDSGGFGIIMGISRPKKRESPQ